MPKKGVGEREEGVGRIILSTDFCLWLLNLDGGGGEGVRVEKEAIKVKRMRMRRKLSREEKVYREISVPLPREVGYVVEWWGPGAGWVVFSGSTFLLVWKLETFGEIIFLTTDLIAPERVERSSRWGNDTFATF